MEFTHQNFENQHFQNSADMYYSVRFRLIDWEFSIMLIDWEFSIMFALNRLRFRVDSES